jgi:hypothetical protein
VTSAHITRPVGAQGMKLRPARTSYNLRLGACPGE